MNGNGNDSKRKLGVWVGGGSVLAVTGGMYLNLSNQTAVAIDVARQHGQEIQLVRTEMSRLSGAIAAIRGVTDDRFRGKDAKEMEERIMERIRMLERHMERLEEKHP